MAQRFGGKFSPGGGNETTPLNARRVDAGGAKANLLFVPPVILAFFSLNDGAIGLALGLVAAALMLLAAWLLREGLRAEAAYNERSIARRPALPRKILAADLCGLGVALAAYGNDGSILAAVLFGIVTAVLHVVAFGIDPLSDKRVEGIDYFQQDRVARVVDEAEAYLTAMADHVAEIKDRHLSERVGKLQIAVRDMIKTVENDPRDLTGARKYLGVYLMGARDAAVKFSDLYRRTGDASARADFETLLDDLEANFAAQTAKMLSDDRTDMDIEIKVLRDRLQREGLKPE